MLYIYQILAFVLIGVSLGALAGDRRVLPAIVGIACAALVFFLHTWWPLALGLAVFLAAQATQQDAARA